MKLVLIQDNLVYVLKNVSIRNVILSVINVINKIEMWFLISIEIDSGSNC